MAFTAGQRVTAAALNGNSMQLIAATSLSSNAASILLQVTANAYPRLKCFWRVRSSVAATAERCQLQINSDVGSNYLYEVNQANNASVAGTTSGAPVAFIQIGTATGNTATAGYFSSGEFVLDGANDATNAKTAAGSFAAFSATNSMWAGTFGGLWSGAASVTSVTLFAQSGQLMTGSSFSLYGLS